MPGRVMLITPPYHCGVVESAGRWPNLALIYMTGELEKAGFEVDLYDAMSLWHDFDQIRKRIQDFQPDYLGVTAITATLPDSVRVAGIAKEECPEVTTVVGGVHATFLFEEVLTQHAAEIDFCVLGEGEHTLPELLLAHQQDGDLSTVAGIAYRENGHVRTTAPRPFLQDLDSLSPAWHRVNWSDYPLYFIEDSHVAIVSSSRGCVYTCSFCSQHKFWQGTYRQRDPDAFVAEIEHLATTYGINVFFISDEYPTRIRARWERILDLLIEKNLGVHILMETCVQDILRDRDLLPRYRQAGILFIYMGVEATSDEQLREFKKRISFENSRDALKLVRDAGMITESSLILGGPGETPESIRETQALAREYNSDFMHFLFLTPWPYADMYKDLQPHIEVFDYAKYNLVEAIIKPTAMTREEVFDSVLKCYRDYYMPKMPEWLNMKGNDLKRSCLIRGMKAIMENSFLKDHMKGLGGMPADIHKLVMKLGD